MVLPYTSKQYSVLWSMNVIYGKAAIQKYSKISGNFVFNQFPSKKSQLNIFLLKKSFYKILSKLWQQNSIVF